MTCPVPLKPEALFRQVETDAWDFLTTAELSQLSEALGQSRAVDAISFGIGIQRNGYNLFAMGASATGCRTVVEGLLRDQAESGPTPADWCFVNNFQQPQRPLCLSLPAGMGLVLQKDMQDFINDLQTVIPATFESDEYQARRREIEQAYKARREAALSGLESDAAKEKIVLLRTPAGMIFAPLKDDEVMNDDDFEKLPDDTKEHIRKQLESYRQALEQLFNQVPQWRREKQQQIHALDRQLVTAAVASLINNLKERYCEQENVLRFLQSVELDVIDNSNTWWRHEDVQEAGEQGSEHSCTEGNPLLQQYQINLLVDHGKTRGAPVILEDNPSFSDLFGRVEYVAHMGTLVTNFKLIKGGALHRANGGYLLLDVRSLLMQPFAWEELKRCLFSNLLRIESLGQRLSLVNTVSLEPEPIPLNVKVVLVGNRLLYYLLYHYDPDFRELFKVVADFEEDMDRSPETQLLQARQLATLIHKEQLLPFHRDAVARMIEYGSRQAGDAGKLSVYLPGLTDLLREADYWARQSQHAAVQAMDVRRATDERIRRAERLCKKIQEAIYQNTILIDTQGSKVGQVNGLSVVALGDFAFSHPTRITACVRLGTGKVVDIQREVALGGPIHSKGVLILCGFLGAHYCTDRPLSLSASLVFEQTYGEVDGDSASCAELCTLLSALAGLPLKQGLSVTGSVNQQGEVQAIGAVNEKIEGFFDICKARGLNGGHGVVIPAANVKHLMLRDEVVAACRAGMFGIYPVATVDEAMTLLTELPAGVRDKQTGEFAVGSVNRQVEERLLKLAESAHAYRAGDNLFSPLAKT